MVFNGLKGADLILYNYLHEADLSRRISVSEMSEHSNYHPNTIYISLKRLEEWRLIERHRDNSSEAYRYKILNGRCCL